MVAGAEGGFHDNVAAAAGLAERFQSAVRVVAAGVDAAESRRGRMIQVHHRSRWQWLVDSAPVGFPCSHSAQTHRHRETLAEGVEKREYRWWAAERSWSCCVAGRRPTDHCRRDGRGQTPSSPCFWRPDGRVRSEDGEGRNQLECETKGWRAFATPVCGLR